MSPRTMMYGLAGAIILGAISIFSNVNSNAFEQRAVLKLNNNKISLIVSDSAESRTRGLSGMASLGEDHAMLFVFEEPDRYGIWMKDMKFPIDIVWLDEQKKIIHIEKNVSPNTYPKVFFPPLKSLYVLELNTGFASKNNLIIGESLNF